MAEAPSISVVIPARDAAATLGETLASLAAQTSPGWEAIIIDDGSTDETPAIAAAAAAADKRIRLLSGPGLGAAAARNTGLAAARGRWLHFLDADDWVAPTFHRRLLEALEGTDAVAAFCADRRVMPDGALSPPRGMTGLADAPFRWFARSCAVAIHAVLVERRAVVEIGGFDPSLAVAEDWDLWQRIARTGRRWVEIAEPLAFYRATGSSLSRSLAPMLADAATVIARGFAADPRVPAPHPDLAGGARPEDGSAALALSLFALWVAGSAIGEGSDGGEADRCFGALPEAPSDARMVAATLLDGLSVGARRVPAAMAAAWPDYGHRVVALIERIGASRGDPGAARGLLYAFERLLLDHDDLAAPRRLALTLGQAVDLAQPIAIGAPPGVDTLYVEVRRGSRTFGRAVTAMLGSIDRGALARGTPGRIAPRVWLRATLRRGPAGLLPLARAGARAARWRARQRPPGSGLGFAAALKSGLVAEVAASAGCGPGSHAAALAALAAEARRDRPVPPPAVPPAVGTEAPSPDADHRAFWERFFAKADQWSYESDYEQEKYRHQLRLIAPLGAARALELACAEGRFTAMLAPLVGELHAVDIAATAVARARERCAARPDIVFGVLDLVTDPLPEDLDLITCSEVLYYLADVAELDRVAERIAAALRPGGAFVHAHAFVLTDNPATTGFDWDHPFGAETIAARFAAAGLVLEHSIRTDLYRVDRFRKPAAGDTAPRPAVETVAIQCPPEPHVERLLVRGGVAVRRTHVLLTERRRQVPVLMYHRVAEGGPDALARYRVRPALFEEQLIWLRRHGFHAIGSDELLWFMTHRVPFHGRPVLLTFDDGTQDFADTAWPLLRRHDFKAEVMLVTDRIGDAAVWDSAYGPPAPLMAAETIAELAGDGALFGSHLASHTPAPHLSTHALAAELLRARATIGALTGRPPVAFTAPYSIGCPRLAGLAVAAGHGIGYVARSGLASIDDDPLDTPRIEVRGDADLDAFVATMAQALP